MANIVAVGKAHILPLLYQQDTRFELPIDLVHDRAVSLRSWRRIRQTKYRHHGPLHRLATFINYGKRNRLS